MHITKARIPARDIIEISRTIYAHIWVQSWILDKLRNCGAVEQSHRAMNADYNGASKEGVVPRHQGQPDRFGSVTIVSRVVTEYLQLYLCICLTVYLLCILDASYRQLLGTWQIMQTINMVVGERDVRHVWHATAAAAAAATAWQRLRMCAPKYLWQLVLSAKWSNTSANCPHSACSRHNSNLVISIAPLGLSL